MAERELKRCDQNRAWRLTAKRYYMFVLLLLIMVVFSVVKLGQVEFFGRGHFLSPDSIINILRMAVPIITLSSGFTLLIISGNIDLSVGSALSLSSVCYALMVLSGFGFWPSLLLTLVIGCVLGAINGMLVMKLRITPIIATLVTLNLFKGIALLIVPDGLSGIKGSDLLKMPDWISFYARKNVYLGLPAAFYVAVGVIILLAIIQRYTIIGKYAAAIGGNRTAAELSGINTVKMGWLLYIVVGFLASLAGVAGASYNSMGNPLAGDGLETDCIIAVLLGGTSFAGGEGSVIKTVIGALIIMCVTTGLMTVVDPFYQILAKGLVLLLAVVLNHLLVRETVSA